MIFVWPHSLLVEIINCRSQHLWSSTSPQHNTNGANNAVTHFALIQKEGIVALAIWMLHLAVLQF